MLPKINRVKKKTDFDNVFKKGNSYKNKFLILKTLPNGLLESRFAFIVSQKVSKKAVTRNKIRRRLSESARTELKNIKGNIDFVFIALPGIEKQNYLDLKNSFLMLLQKCLKQ